jgi:hypothetical protein
MEHLYQFADHAFPNNPSVKVQWCEQQKEVLLALQVETVIDNISSTQAGEKDKKQLIAYYQNNKKRMRYAQYQKVGCGIIGSVATESAHRTVIQKRMKLSGQRWSTDGVKTCFGLGLFL